jgi:ParB-like chromosome segregation protein Spo0J
MDLVKKFPVDKVKFHPDWPYRKEKGFLDGLTKSLGGKNGILQPIGLTRDHFLVYGSRRLAAAKKNGWTTIPALIMDLDSPLQAMKEENEGRLQFNQSEMTAIMRAVELDERKKAKSRQDAGLNKGRSRVGNISHTEEGRAVDNAAAAFGKSGKTFEAMKKVDEAATEELKDAWNEGIVTTSDAASIVDEPAKIQKEAVKRVRKGKAKTVKGAAKQIKDETKILFDREGNEVPKRLRDVFVSNIFQDSIANLKHVATVARNTDAWNPFFLIGQAMDRIEQLLTFFEQSIPHVICPHCKGEECNKCCKAGWLPEWRWKEERS